VGFSWLVRLLHACETPQKLGILKTYLTKIHNFAVELIGESSTSEVYRGIQIDSKECVAKRESEPSQLENEAGQLYKLSNSKFPQLFPRVVYRENKTLFLTPVGSPLLNEMIQDSFRQQKQKLALKYTADLVKVLHAAHTINVVHHDIRAANVIIVEGKAMLIDWGLATTAEQEESVLSGTTRWLSSQILKKQKRGRWTFSRRDDMESLGYVLMYMIRGQLPWRKAETFEAVLQKREDILSDEGNCVEVQFLKAISQSEAKLKESDYFNLEAFLLGKIKELS